MELKKQGKKHEEEWEAILAKFHGKVASTKESERIGKYLDKYVNDLASLRKIKEEDWKLEDEQSLIKVEKANDAKRRDIEFEYNQKERDIRASYNKALDQVQKTNEMFTGQVSYESPTKTIEKLSALAAQKTESENQFKQ